MKHNHMLKKFILAFSIIAIFTVYSLYQYYGFVQISDTPAANNARPIINEPLPTDYSDNSTPIPNALPPAAPPPAAPASSGAYRDGSYNGSLVDAYYGNLRVQAVIKNGKISDVIFLSYANDRRNSIVINQYAMPILKSEAIQAQSAQVDIVSGATFTSQAFNQSLAYALNQAKN